MSISSAKYTYEYSDEKANGAADQAPPKDRMSSASSACDNSTKKMDSVDVVDEEAGEAKEGKCQCSTRTKIKLVALVVCLAVVLVIVIVLPVGEWINSFLEWVDDQGVVGVILYAAVYYVATILLIPGLILTIGAGFVYNVVIGSLIVWVASNAGAITAFFIGRYLLREMVENMAKKYPVFGAIDRAVGDHGLKLVFLMRLSPVLPFNVLNYSLGITTVKWWQCLLASLIGMLPGTIMFVYIGSVARSISDIATEDSSDASGSDPAATGRTVLFIVGLVATILVVVLVSYIAGNAVRKELKAAKEEIDDEDGEGDDAAADQGDHAASGEEKRSLTPPQV